MLKSKYNKKMFILALFCAIYYHQKAAAQNNAGVKNDSIPNTPVGMLKWFDVNPDKARTAVNFSLAASGEQGYAQTYDDNTGKLLGGYYPWAVNATIALKILTESNSARILACFVADFNSQTQTSISHYDGAYQTRRDNEFDMRVFDVSGRWKFNSTCDSDSYSYKYIGGGFGTETRLRVPESFNLSTYADYLLRNAQTPYFIVNAGQENKRIGNKGEKKSGVEIYGGISPFYAYGKNLGDWNHPDGNQDNLNVTAGISGKWESTDTLGTKIFGTGAVNYTYYNKQRDLDENGRPLPAFGAEGKFGIESNTFGGTIGGSAYSDGGKVGKIVSEFHLTAENGAKIGAFGGTGYDNYTNHINTTSTAGIAVHFNFAGIKFETHNATIFVTFYDTKSHKYAAHSDGHIDTGHKYHNQNISVSLKYLLDFVKGKNSTKTW